jgi:hypothetical protein
VTGRKVSFALEQAVKKERYSSTLSLTSALGGGVWLMTRLSRFAPREINPVPVEQKVGWVQVWTSAENLAPHRGSVPEPSRPYRVTHYTVNVVTLVL